LFAVSHAQAEKKVTSKKKLARERRQLAQLGPVEA
jgi:hypothetical protein